MLAYHYFIWKKWILWLSSCLFHFFSIFCTSQIILSSITAGTFQPCSSSPYPVLIYPPFYRAPSPPLTAEEPQYLLSTFSHHLSPFHRHHYLPLFSAIYSLCLSSSLSASVSSVFFLSCRQQLRSALHTHPHTSVYLLIAEVKQILSHLLVGSFDIHWITPLAESIWPQDMKAIVNHIQPVGHRIRCTSIYGMLKDCEANMKMILSIPISSAFINCLILSLRRFISLWITFG